MYVGICLGMNVLYNVCFFLNVVVGKLCLVFMLFLNKNQIKKDIFSYRFYKKQIIEIRHCFIKLKKKVKIKCISLFKACFILVTK